MPFRPKHTLLSIDVDKMHTIDTRSVENLFGMWSVFSKSSEALEDGKRLENLSWRLWNRETFCCCPETQARSTISSPCAIPPRAKPSSIPELASSVETVSSTGSTADDETLTSLQPPSANLVRPELTRMDTCESRSRGREKHITPIDLEKIVTSIKEKKVLEPLSPLPIPAPSEPERQATAQPASRQEKMAQKEEHAIGSQQDLQEKDTPAVEKQPSPKFHMNLESSASTVATGSSNDSQVRTGSESSCTTMSTHNIVRGFVPGGATSSYRSQTQLAAQPTPILKNSPRNRHGKTPKQKGAMFTLGTSSDEGEGSLDSHIYKNSLGSVSEALQRPGPRKQTLFKEEVSQAIQDSPVFESDDDDDDDDVSDNAIDDDDEDSDEWEDEMVEEGPSSADERDLFQRVDSRPNLTSRRSLITTQIHEPDRAKALANAASRSTPALRGSRTSSPSGPSAAAAAAASPRQAPSQGPSALASGSEMSQPLIITPSNTNSTNQPSLSPRTTRRNMLSTELTESLRRNLLWERQHKSSQNIAALKRRHTSADVKNLKQHPEPILKQAPEPQPILSSKENIAGKFSNEYFHAGLQDFHAKGW